MMRGARGGPRLFATPEDEPRARRASDVVVLLAGVLALVLISFAAEPSPGFARSLDRFVTALPDFPVAPLGARLGQAPRHRGVERRPRPAIPPMSRAAVR